MDFIGQHCVPCEGGTQPLTKEKVGEYLKVVPGWHTDTEALKIHRAFVFKDFVSAIAFIDAMADIAEGEGHHPNFNLHGWNKMEVELSTHAINGLSNNDFILAAKLNQYLHEHASLLKQG